MLRSFLVAAVVSRVSFAGSELICPGSETSLATYDPATGLLPEESTPPWTVVDDGASAVTLTVHGNEPVLRVVDDFGPFACEHPTSPGLTYALPDDSLAGADVFGVQARLRVDSACRRPRTSPAPSSARSTASASWRCPWRALRSRASPS